MRISLVLILIVCFLQAGSGRKSSGGSSRGSIGGGGWSTGGSRGSSSGGGWGSSSRNTGTIGGGGWSSGGSSSSSRGSIGGGGWNLGGSSSSSSSNSRTNPGKKKGILGGIFGGKKKDPSLNTGGKKKGLFGGLFGKKKSAGGVSTKKKGGKLKTLKKAAVIGAAVYGGYKLGKLTSRFGSYGHNHNFGYGFNDWNKWRSKDGFLCRNNMDCTWIDPSLECDDYEFDFSPSNLWFGGDVASIRGQCECKDSFFWNDDDLHCLRRRSYSGGSVAQGITGLAIGLLVAGLMMCCCCVVGCAFVVRMIMGRSSE